MDGPTLDRLEGVVLRQFHIDRARLADFCERHQIRKFSLFGSVLRDDFGPTSDVDVLVEFAPGSQVGLIRLAGMELELSKILGRKTDLRTPAELSRYFRADVLRTAQVEYVRK